MSKHHKITPEDLVEMRVLRQQGLTLAQIAGKCGFSAPSVHRALSGKSKRLIKRPDEIPVPFVRQKRCGVRPREEILNWHEINMAATNWLIERGLWRADNDIGQYWGALDKHENET